MQNELKKYREKENYNYSCSEAILYAANEFYNLGLETESFKMMAPFSGGMFEGETCGVVTGGISVLGIIFTKNKKANSPEMIEIVKEFKLRFLEEIKSRDCTRLKEIFNEECDPLILRGGKILEEVISKYRD